MTECKMVGMSKYHLTKETYGNYLHEEQDSPITFVGDGGYFGKIIRILGDEREYNLPEDLMRIVVFAEARGVEYIRFDDGFAETDGLPVYDW